MPKIDHGPEATRRERAGEPPDATTAVVLERIETHSPFETDGRLPPGPARLIARLDPVSLGTAVTSLVRHAAALPRIAAARAAAAVEDLLGAGTGQRPVDIVIDTPALTEIYERLAPDPRHPVRMLIDRLMSMDRGATAEAPPVGAEPPPVGAEPPFSHAEPPPPAPPGRTRMIQFPPEATPRAAPPARPTRAEPPATVRPVGAAPGSSRAEPPMAAPPAAPQPRTYRAYGLLDSDETVLVGRPFELTVGLSPSSPPGVAGPPLELPRPDAASYDLDIQLFADGFDLEPGELWRHSLVVSKDDLFPTVAVHLTARDLPEPRAVRSITATFSIGGETLGAATRQIIVTTDPDAVGLSGGSATASGTNIAAPTGLPPADMTITIKRGLEPGALQWAIESSLPSVGLADDRPAESDIGDDPEEFATAIIKKLFVQGHRMGVVQLLQGIGKTIRDEMPLAVRNAIAAGNAAVAPRTLDILLLTEEPFIPWELAWIDEPFDPKAPRYLGAQVNLGRWALEPETIPTDPPRHVDASTMSVVWGIYKSAGLQRLEAAEQEALKIQKQYKATSIDARPDLVYPLLAGTPPADILHFAVHGRYNPQGADEGIYLTEGPPIDPFQIRGSDLSARAPFVFLNACQVGAGQNLLGNYAGIAQAFIRIGASGVVAALWSIDDKIAQKIALEFYRHALDSRAGAGGEPPTVADLLRKARRGLLKNPDELASTYLAYQFYGHPSLRLSWNPETADGGQPNG